MPPLYRIVDWNEHFENNRTRELKNLPWVRMPTKMDGDGFTELMDHPNGTAHMGAWHLMAKVAARCRPRGTLMRAVGVPHNSTSLARITRVPKEIFDEALPRFLNVGWIEDLRAPEPVRAIPQGGAAPESQDGAPSGEERRGEERREEETHGTPVRGEPVRQTQIDAIYGAYPLKKEPQAAKRAIKKAVKLIQKRDENNDHKWLLARTLLFARIVSTWPEDDKDYLKYPATWFNKGCYDEDEATWPKTAKPLTPDERASRAADGIWGDLGKPKE